MISPAPTTPGSAAAGALAVAGRIPGVLLCGFVALAAIGLAAIEHRLFGATWLEPLVLAILLGAGIRVVWTPERRFAPGVAFSARTLLEIAVLLLGASISAAAVAALGLPLLIGLAILVALTIAAGVGIGTLFGLNPKMAVLIACGNAICGNSAIAAVAPVIDADAEDVAAAIAFTAVLGVVVVLCLPLAGVALSLSERQYGVLTGASVYAVPQVLAAAAPFGLLAVQTGTVVKLVRVLMLGPVVLVLSLVFAGARSSGKRPGLATLVPWFIVGFVGLAGLRSAGLIPATLLPVLAEASALLTVLAMAALGLQTDVRAVFRAGGGVIGTVVGSLLCLTLLCLILIALAGVR